jgi:hypothetical protein
MFEISLSILAAILSVAAFSREIWRTWRDRPRLRYYISKVTLQNVPHFGEMTQIQILVCNTGYRPIILVGFRALGETSAFYMGIHDEPAAALGIDDRRFPVKIDPGVCVAIHPLEVKALERNQTDPQDKKVHFDPWKLFVLEDSFGRFHVIEIEDVKRELRMGGSWKRKRGMERVRHWAKRRLFLRRACKRLHLR